MYTVQTPTSKTKLDQLLNISISQHGYWLVNHREVIEDDLKDLLNRFGLITTASILNEIDNPIVIKLYKKIEENR